MLCYLQVVDSLKIGNNSLKEINMLLSIEDVEKILDETHEAAEKQEVSHCHQSLLDKTLRLISCPARLLF